MTTALCHHRTYEEETSENEAVAEEEEEKEEGEEDVFTDEVSPEAEECPALKVKRASLRRSFFLPLSGLTEKALSVWGRLSKWAVYLEVAVPAR